MDISGLTVIGYASGIGGVDATCADGPLAIQQVTDLKSLHWNAMIQAAPSHLRIDERIAELNRALANRVNELLIKNQSFCVLGGDHTSAIGTWSGVRAALNQKGEMGLIWIDAHMDSHTPETSLSGRLHGMPLATLLGYGYPSLTRILGEAPKLKPENVCLIGVRSYEASEAALLKRLNVKIYYMDEVKQRGFNTIWREAVDLVSRHTAGYGISLDLDGIDPSEAPGVDVPEPNGLSAEDVKKALSISVTDPHFIGAEIVEFDPSRDKNNITKNLVVSLLQILAKGK